MVWPFLIQLSFLATLSPQFSGGDDPLAVCNAHDAEYARADIEWAAACLLTAIRAQDRAALIALSSAPGVTVAADGTFAQEAYVFGPEVWPGAPPGKLPLAALAAGPLVTRMEPWTEGGVDGMIVLYAANGAAPTVEGWLETYFACAFAFDEGEGRWMIPTHFCFSETIPPLAPGDYG